MNFNLLQRYGSRYCAYLSTARYRDLYFIWQCLRNFQEHWNLQHEDLAQMYDRALSNMVSRQLWGGDQHSAKSVMLKFFSINPDFTSAMFRDLFNQKLDLTQRLQRFRFHCDQMVAQLRAMQPSENYHFHDSAKMPLLYLSLRYPDNHCIYDHELFVQVLRKIKAKEPEKLTIDRFQNICTVLQQVVLSQDEMRQILIKNTPDTDVEWLQSRFSIYFLYRFIGEDQSH